MSAALPYGPVWTPEREAELIALHNGPDLPLDREVARVMGLSPGSVYGRLCLLRAHGLIEARPPGRKETPYPAPSADLETALARHATGGWSVEKLLKLCAGWCEGVTTQALADRLGVTKNALVGKVHRLVARGILEGRPSPLAAGKGQGKPRERRTVAVSVHTLPAPPPIQPPPPPPPPPPSPPPPVRAPSTTCRWPMWRDNERATGLYCAVAVPLGQSWCTRHHRIVFLRVRAA